MVRQCTAGSEAHPSTLPHPCALCRTDRQRLYRSELVVRRRNDSRRPRLEHGGAAERAVRRAAGCMVRQCTAGSEAHPSTLPHPAHLPHCRTASISPMSALRTERATRLEHGGAAGCGEMRRAAGCMVRQCTAGSEAHPSTLPHPAHSAAPRRTDRQSLACALGVGAKPSVDPAAGPGIASRDGCPRDARG